MKYFQMFKFILISKFEFKRKKLKVILYIEEQKNENIWVLIDTRIKFSGRTSYNIGLIYLYMIKERVK